MSVATLGGAEFGDADRFAAELWLRNELNQAAAPHAGSLAAHEASLGFGQEALVGVDPLAGERLVNPEAPYFDIGSSVLHQVTDADIRRFFDNPDTAI